MKLGVAILAALMVCCLVYTCYPAGSSSAAFHIPQSFDGAKVPHGGAAVSWLLVIGACAVWGCWRIVKGK